MIIQLQPSQVATIWDGIKYSIAEANRIPDNVAQDFLNAALTRILSGNIQCWISFKIENDQRQILAITTTEIVDDKVYGIRLFKILTIYGFRACPDEVYTEGLAALREFAKAKGCKGIIAETYNSRVKSILAKNGFEEHSVVYQATL